MSCDNNDIEIKYNQTLEELYGRLQAFHRVGSSAYKPGLGTARTLAAAFDNPQNKFKTIHVGGTNGKGSTAHSLAAVLTAAGYKVGLYTSPHLVDFAERIRVDGKKIEHTAVLDFVSRYKTMTVDCDPSFFELTTIMAFDYFARQKVDVAVIEVGLGGRLDTTNIIMPALSIITNISLDHTAILGNTLGEIATEKAGIFKPGVPAVVGDSNPDLRDVFVAKAREVSAPLVFAGDCVPFTNVIHEPNAFIYNGTRWGDVACCLTGECQEQNTATILTALNILSDRGFKISAHAVKQGLSDVCRLTGLMGRWMTVSHNPLVVCDTGHNVGAWQYLGSHLGACSTHKSLAIVIGFVSDKDYRHIMALMPHKAHYYIVSPSVSRAADAETVADAARRENLDVRGVDDSVIDGYKKALADVGESGMVFVGGSTFVVADFLSYVNERQ